MRILIVPLAVVEVMYVEAAHIKLWDQGPSEVDSKVIGDRVCVAFSFSFPLSFHSFLNRQLCRLVSDLAIGILPERFLILLQEL